MKLKFRALTLTLCWLLLACFAPPAAAHTLPISYLRLVVQADYLHMELVFNPFELTFMRELDENKDAELDPNELAAHGQALAERVAAAIKLTAGDIPLRPETTGMDPDLNGHHVRLRAHYKVDARRLPLTVESDLAALTSSSHLTQVTYLNGSRQQLAQLDSRSRKVTFQPPAEPEAAGARVGLGRRTALGLELLAAAVLVAALGAALRWRLRKHRNP